MTGSSTTARVPVVPTNGIRKLVALMVGVLIVSAAIAFSPSVTNQAMAPDLDRRVDYAFRHLGELPPLPARTSRLDDYGVRHLASSVDWSRAPDYALRHLED